VGTREIRFCDISGVEDDVDSHALQIDQMRIEIDLAAGEYRRLLEVLRPYIDAGRVEASVPTGDRSLVDGKPAAPRKAAGGVPALSPRERQQVRQWAESKGMDVPVNNRFKRAVIEQWRQETQLALS
jgi:hypothetical protein